MPFRLPYRKDKDAFLLEISLQTPRQLFNTLDPSPFHEKDLDPAAERYLVDAVEELPLNEDMRLLVHLPEDAITDDLDQHIQTAVQNYFRYRAMVKLHALRRSFREGRTALMVGLVFLVSCSLLRELALVYGKGFSNEMLAEGLLIIGWVALWRPADILLYDWWPLLRRYRLLSKISRLTVEIRPSVVRAL
jgi:hypothetical protein